MSAFDNDMYVVCARKMYMYMYIDTDNVYVQKVMQVASHAMKRIKYILPGITHYIKQFAQVRIWKLKKKTSGL